MKDPDMNKDPHQGHKKQEDTELFGRRAFFQKCAIGAITGTASLLFYKAWKSGEDCIGSGKCRVCFAVKKCDLPLAHDFRKENGIEKRSNNNG